jgi:hypothetical protein
MQLSKLKYHLCRINNSTRPCLPNGRSVSIFMNPYRSDRCRSAIPLSYIQLRTVPQAQQQGSYSKVGYPWSRVPTLPYPEPINPVPSQVCLGHSFRRLWAGCPPVGWLDPRDTPLYESYQCT